MYRIINNTKRILCSFLLINTIVISLTAYHLIQNRNHYRTVARNTTNNLARVLCSDIRSDIKGVDFMLMSVVDEYRHINSRNAADHKSFTAYLQRHKSFLGEIDVIRLADETGNVLYGVESGTSLNIADRDFFRAARNNPYSTLIISKPLVGKITNRWMLFMARRINKADGSFGGVVYGGYFLDTLKNKFSQVNIGKNGTIVLRDTELGLITRFPEIFGSAGAPGVKNASDDLQALVKNGHDSGDVETYIPSDNTYKIGSFYRLKPYPLFVMVGLGRDDFLAPWYKEVKVAAVIELFVILLSGLAAGLLLKKEKQRAVSQARLLESEKMFSTTFNSNPAMMAISTIKEGRYLEVNSAFHTVLGYSKEEVIGRTTLELGIFQDPGMRQEIIDLLHKNTCVRNFQVTAQDKSGQIHYGLLSADIIRLKDEELLLSVVVDITARIETEQALVKAIDASEAANRAKTQFLANMSHELRTPLNGMLGMAQLLGFTALDSEQKGYVDTIISSGGNLVSLINDILDMARIDTGKMALEVTGFKPGDSIRDVIAAQRPLAERKGLIFSFEIQPDVPDTLYGDPPRLRQLARNLIGNAVKFTETGSVSARLKVREHQGAAVLLELVVQDTGIGIAPDKLQTVFEPFTQVDGSDNRSYGGSGLGLSISRRLVELMGGSLEVESTEGQGSTFRALMLLRTEAPPPPPPPPPPARRKRGVGGHFVRPDGTNKSMGYRKGAYIAPVQIQQKRKRS